MNAMIPMVSADAAWSIVFSTYLLTGSALFYLWFRWRRSLGSAFAVTVALLGLALGTVWVLLPSPTTAQGALCNGTAIDAAVQPDTRLDDGTVWASSECRDLGRRRIIYSGGIAALTLVVGAGMLHPRSTRDLAMTK